MHPHIFLKKNEWNLVTFGTTEQPEELFESANRSRKKWADKFHILFAGSNLTEIYMPSTSM